MDEHERQALRDTVTRLYQQVGDPRRPDRSDAWVWGRLRDLGLLGIAIPTEHGGGGGGLTAAGSVAEIRGAFCSFGGYPETAGLAFGLAGASADPAVATLLSGVASSGWQLMHLRPSLEGPEPRGVYLPMGAVPTIGLWQTVEPDGRTVVRFGDVHDVGSSRELRSTARLPIRQVTVDAPSVGEPLALAAEDWTRATMAAEGLQYAEIVGACRWLQRDARRYATERVQFGQPIGNFQAVQHQLVDMLAWVDAAELLIRTALHRIEEGAGGRELVRAGAFIRDRAWSCLFGSYTVLGGMGFIEEMPVNTYCRRVLAVLSRFGPIADVEEQSAGYVGRDRWLAQRA